MAEDLVAQVEAMLAYTGAEVIGLGPDSVAVMGDSRFYGPSIVIKFPPGTTNEKIAEISTKITNEVKGISRVLIEIPLV